MITFLSFRFVLMFLFSWVDYAVIWPPFNERVLMWCESLHWGWAQWCFSTSAGSTHLYYDWIKLQHKKHVQCLNSSAPPSSSLEPNLQVRWMNLIAAVNVSEQNVLYFSSLLVEKWGNCWLVLWLVSNRTCLISSQRQLLLWWLMQSIFSMQCAERKKKWWSVALQLRWEDKDPSN